MKKLLVLSGNSVHNREWGETCAEFFRSDFDRVYFLHYDHWTSGEPLINFATELDKINEIVVGSGEQNDWYIFAKSIGTVLTMTAVLQVIIRPEKCVFFGMPLGLSAYDDWSFLSEFSRPTIAFHNTKDPTAPYDETIKKLSELAPTTIVLKTREGDTHDYLDFASYNPEIQTFLTPTTAQNI